MQNGVHRKPAVVVTRDELYQQVWQTPMSRLAAKYGISGTGLAKICKKLNVPYPPRGWWAKKAAGKTAITYRLPPAGSATPSSVTIRPTPAPVLSPADPEAGKEVAEAAEMLGLLNVSQRLTKPHPVIARWIDDHARRKAEAARERDSWSRDLLRPSEFTPLDRRRHRLLDALFKALERNGGRVKENDQRRLLVQLSGEDIEFQLREKQRRGRRLLTDDEKRWRSNSGRDWTNEMQGTERLAFSIRTHLGSGLQSEWVESDEAPMESLLPTIIATFLAASTVLVARRRKREEEEELRRIEERRRAEERERQLLDDNRWRRFTDLAEASSKAQVAREFVAALKALPANVDDEVGGQPIKDWLVWAEHKLEQGDPLAYGIDRVFADVARITTWTYRGSN